MNNPDQPKRSPDSSPDARGSAVMAHQLCGQCGHARDEHNGRGDCMHYDVGGCGCFAFVRPEDTTPEMRANRLFPRHWNVVYFNPTPFQPGGPCQAATCEGGTVATVRRIMVNIWGTVCEYDVCEACGERYHGKMMDDFPYRAPPPPQGTEDASMQSRVHPGDDVGGSQAHQEVSDSEPNPQDRAEAFRSIAERAIKEAIARGEIQIEDAHT